MLSRRVSRLTLLPPRELTHSLLSGIVPHRLEALLRVVIRFLLGIGARDALPSIDAQHPITRLESFINEVAAYYVPDLQARASK